MILDHHDDEALVESEILLGNPAAPAIAGQRWIETAREPGILGDLRIALAEMT